MIKTQLLTIEGLRVNVIRSSRRTLSLEIGPEGLRARAPLRMRESSIAQFVRQKRAWIERHLQDQAPPPEPISLVSGATLRYRGEKIVLSVHLDSRAKPSFNQGVLHLPVCQSHLPIEVTIRNKLILWYKQRALQTLEQSIARHAPLMALDKPPASDIKVREYRRRWGSCDHRGRLSFNWRIIMAPKDVLDYVVVHELAHRHEFNHSKRFWRIVERQIPNWHEQQDWLQTYGAQLYRF